jgi:hypothetical protein
LYFFSPSRLRISSALLAAKTFPTSKLSDDTDLCLRPLSENSPLLRVMLSGL